MANDKTYDRHIKKKMHSLTKELTRTKIGTKEYNYKADKLRRLIEMFSKHKESVKAFGSAWRTIKNVAGAIYGKIIKVSL